MRIAIVDDDIQMCEQLSTLLNEFLGDSSEISDYRSGEEFLTAWETADFDLIILDIFMDKLTGVDVARKIRERDSNVKIVFSTTSNEFASESYEVNVMLDRLNLAEIEKMRTVKLPDGTSAILRNIIYVDFSSHRVTLHCKYDVDTIVRTSFSEIESLLCAYPYFSSPTKGMLINFYEVASQTNDVFVMSDGKSIPISRRKSKEVLDAYFTFRFEMLRNGGGK